MRKLGSWTVALGAVLAIVLVTSMAVRPAQARPNYMKWFIKDYPEVAKKNELKNSSCTVCHAPGTDKHKRNDFGKAIVKALAGSKSVKKAAFEEALKTAVKDKAPDSDKTYGEILDAGDLPVK